MVRRTRPLVPQATTTIPQVPLEVPPGEDLLPILRRQTDIQVIQVI